MHRFVLFQHLYYALYSAAISKHDLIMFIVKSGVLSSARAQIESSYFKRIFIERQKLQAQSSLLNTIEVPVFFIVLVHQFLSACSDQFDLHSTKCPLFPYSVRGQKGPISFRLVSNVSFRLVFTRVAMGWCPPASNKKPTVITLHIPFRIYAPRTSVPSIARTSLSNLWAKTFSEKTNQDKTLQPNESTSESEESIHQIKEVRAIEEKNKH